jgi:cytochrome c oxidase subunit I+III
MPRRVFTYPAELGLDGLNLVSTIGAFILALGFLVVVWDVVRPKRSQPYAERNPWSAGTLEWVSEMPGRRWGIRASRPRIPARRRATVAA